MGQQKVPGLGFQKILRGRIKRDPESESDSRSVVSDSATPWTAARQAPLSMGFSRQEHWSGLPFPSLGRLPNPGIELALLHCRQTLSFLSNQKRPCGPDSGAERLTLCVLK